MARQYYQVSFFDARPFVMQCGRLSKAMEMAMMLSEAQRRPAYVLARRWDPFNTGNRYAACLRMDVSSLVAEHYRVIARVDSRIRWKVPRGFS